MQRVFTREVGRYKAGEVREYSWHTWNEIAASARMPLDRFSKPAEDAARESVERRK